MLRLVNARILTYPFVSVYLFIFFKGVEFAFLGENTYNFCTLLLNSNALAGV